jgi:hypothetical protein
MKLNFKALSLLSFIFLTGEVCAQVTSNFSINDESWTESDINNLTPQTVNYNATGGNPGGYISVMFPGGQPGYWNAPAKFLGDQCLSSYGLNLKFDLQFSSITSLQHSGNGDVILKSGSTSILINLPSFPALAPSWTSYTIKLDDTAGWKYGSIGGAVATADQIKTVLSNLTDIRINGQYQLAASTVSGIDNVVFEKSTLSTPPAITNFSPTSGIPNIASVTVNGSNFNTTATNNIVYFAGVAATVTSATATKLVVTVPPGAQFAPIIVVDKTTGLSASSVNPFTPLFNNNNDNGASIIRASLGNVVSFDVATNAGSSAAGDIDGDGLNDLVVGEGSGGFGGFHQFSVFRNAGVTGTISSATFHPKVSFNITNPYVKGNVALADFDGDGKLDVAVSSATTFNAYVSVFRNTSTSGNISFTGPQDYLAYSYSDGPLAAADMDGDGRPEIIGVFNNNCASGDRLYMFPNRSTPGTIDFCGMKTFGNVYTCGGYVTIGDLNGDKLNDAIVTAGSNSVTIFENTSTPGSLSMGTPFQISTTSYGNAIIADLDNDGLNDIGWGDYSTSNIILKKNVYAGGALSTSSFGTDITLTSPLGYIQDQIAAGDFNGDGKIDLLLAGNTDVALFQNVFSGSLSATSFLYGVPYEVGGSSAYPLFPILADFDGDNKLDVSVKASNTAKLYLFRNESYPAPKINSFTQTSGVAGDVIAFTGSLLKTGAVSPNVVVRHGKLLAASTISNNASGSFTIPSGSQTDRISITAHGLTTLSEPFPIKFATTGPIDNTSFGGSIDFNLSNNLRDALDIGDFDDDGKLDVGVIDNYNVLKIFKNTQATAGQSISTSSLTQESTTYTGQYNLISFDIDGDGKVDINNGYGLLQNNSTPGTISFLSGPNGIYTYSGGFNAVAYADFNKDGKIDLAVNNGSNNIQVYQNESTSGAFVNNAYLSTFNTNAVNLSRPDNYGGLVAWDFDGDGYEDLIATNPDYDNITIYNNTKQSGKLTTSSFSLDGNYSVGDNPYGITANDFDGDGKIDIAITYYDAAYVSVMLNQSSIGDINFASSVDLPAASKGYNLTSQDLNGDGKAEIIVIHKPNPGPGSFTVFENKSTAGTLTFGTGVNYSLTTQSRNPSALAVADINNDQKPDILIVGSPYTAASSALMVFENKIITGPVITITQQPADVTVCEGATATFNTDASGTTNITYKWQFSPNTGVYTDINDGGGYTGTSTKSLSVNTTGAFGAGRYRCKISGDLATTVTTSDEGLFINAIPSPPITSGSSACASASLVLHASGASNGQYLWYNVSSGGSAIVGETNDNYTTPVISTTTTYYVSINISACKSSRVAVTATIASLGKPSINSTTPVVAGKINLCEGEEVTLSAPSGFDSYDWSDGSSLGQVTIDQSMTITLIVTDVNSCSSPATDPIEIIVNPYPIATITPNGSTLTASTGDGYQWYSDNEVISNATGQTLEYNTFEYGSYSVDVTDNGCTTRSADFVYLITGIEKNNSVKIYPNPFNDQLFIETENASNVDYALYDLLGRKINTTTNSQNNIITINVKDLSPGTYVFVVKENRQTSLHRIIKTMK